MNMAGWVTLAVALVAAFGLPGGGGALAKGGNAAQATSTRNIPTAFLSDWYDDSAAVCDGQSHGMVQIKRTQFDYPISSNKVTAVQQIKPNRIRVSFTYIGDDGDVRKIKETWALSNQGGKLTITSENGEEPINQMTELYRCANRKQR